MPQNNPLVYPPIIEHIMSFLDDQSLIKISEVNKDFFSISREVLLKREDILPLFGDSLLEKFLDYTKYRKPVVFKPWKMSKILNRKDLDEKVRLKLIGYILDKFNEISEKSISFLIFSCTNAELLPIASSIIFDILTKAQEHEAANLLHNELIGLMLDQDILLLNKYIDFNLSQLTEEQKIDIVTIIARVQQLTVDPLIFHPLAKIYHYYNQYLCYVESFLEGARSSDLEKRRSSISYMRGFHPNEIPTKKINLVFCTMISLLYDMDASIKSSTMNLFYEKDWVKILKSNKEYTNVFFNTLFVLSKDQNADVRKNVAASIQKVFCALNQEQSELAFRTLDKLLEDHDEEVQNSAILTFCAISMRINKEQFNKIIQLYKVNNSEETGEIRDIIKLDMLSIGNKVSMETANQVVEVLISLSKDLDPMVRELAAIAIGSIFTKLTQNNRNIALDTLVNLFREPEVPDLPWINISAFSLNGVMNNISKFDKNQVNMIFRNSINLQENEIFLAFIFDKLTPEQANIAFDKIMRADDEQLFFAASTLNAHMTFDIEKMNRPMLINFSYEKLISSLKKSGASIKF